MKREMIDKSIKTAWIAAVVSAVLTTVAWGAAMAGVPELVGFQCSRPLRASETRY
jgi:hypothetical protein